MLNPITFYMKLDKNKEHDLKMYIFEKIRKINQNAKIVDRKKCAF